MEAIIGVIGTLAGTVLGWLLNSLSQRGKISAYVSQWDNNFKHNRLLGKEPDQITKELVIYYYKLSLDLYNSSGKTRIMRDIKILFRYNQKVLLESVPGDLRTLKVVGKAEFCEKLSAVNVPPKSVLALKLHDNIPSDAKRTIPFWQTNNVVLQYKDEANKAKTILLMNKDFRQYLDNAAMEVAEHG